MITTHYYHCTHLLQPSNLLPYEQIERHLGNEEARSRAVGVVDGCSNVLVVEALERIDGGEALRKDLVKDVTVRKPPAEKEHRSRDKATNFVSAAEMSQQRCLATRSTISRRQEARYSTLTLPTASPGREWGFLCHMTAGCHRSVLDLPPDKPRK